MENDVRVLLQQIFDDLSNEMDGVARNGEQANQLFEAVDDCYCKVRTILGLED